MINSSIYGTSEQWSDVSATSGWNVETMKYKIARFGSGGNTLADGYGYGIEINKPIDKSLSWCGLGNFSTWSKLEYHKVAAEFELIAKDNRSVTNFSWNTSNGGNNGIYLTEKTSVANTRYGALQRFSPNAIMGAGNQTNYNNGITPLAQIPIKNCVLVPYFRVCRTLPTSNSTSGIGLTNIVAWDYYGTTASGNHTTHPYIIAIYFMPHYFSSSTSTTRTTTKFINGHSILDEISLQKDIPLDMDEPDGAKNSGVYAYNIFKPYSILNGIQIFGHSYNDFGIGVSNDFIYYNKQAFASGSSSTFTNNIHGAILYPHDNAQMTPEYASGSNFVRFYYLEYYDGLREWVRKQLACFGLFFTDVKAVAESGELNNDDMLLGILDDNNIGQGFYSHGEENEQQKQWNWDTTNDSDYNPSGGGGTDPNVYNGVMDTAGAPIALATATERYVIADTNINKLLTKLWDVMALADPTTMTKSDYALDTFLTNNPIDAIVSLQYVPVKDMGIGLTTVALGKYDTQIPAAHAETSVVKDCGTIEIFPRCGDNWIDREMKLTLYLPFCGVVDLDPETYINRYCNVEYLIDLTTGTCSAVVSFISDNGNRVITDIANGVCAIDLPVTGLQQQTLNSELFNASESTKQLKVNNAFKGFKSLMGAVNSLQGNPTGAIDSILGGAADFYNIFQSEKIADYNLQHTIIPTKMIGTSGGLTGVMATIKPTIIYSIPVNDVNYSTYGHSIGFACCESGVLSGYSGYTECTNVDLSGFSATTTEKNMIQSALAGGVYL